MFCDKCGNKINEGAAFCAKCGNKIGVYSSINPIAEDASKTLLQTDYTAQEVDVKHQSFWSFVWCDYFYILFFLGQILAVMAVLSLYMIRSTDTSSTSIFSLFVVLFFCILFPLFTIITWRLSANKVAYINAVISLLAWIAMTPALGLVVNLMSSMVFLPISLFNLIMLISVLRDAKSQLTNPYTLAHYHTEITGFDQLKMLLYLAAFTTLTVSLFIPLYKIGGELASHELKWNAKTLLEIMNSEIIIGIIIFIMIYLIIVSVIYLRLTRIAHYIPLVLYIVMGCFVIVKLKYMIDEKAGNNMINVGSYPSVGFYVLLASVICAAAAIVINLFRSRKVNEV